MGRIFDTIHVGKERWHTLFDSGAKNNFVSARTAKSGTVAALTQHHVAEIGGKRHRIRQACVLQGTLRRLPIMLQALVLPEIGSDNDGRTIDILFGADAIHRYGIRLVPKDERLDLSHFQRSFVEFWESGSQS